MMDGNRRGVKLQLKRRFLGSFVTLIFLLLLILVNGVAAERTRVSFWVWGPAALLREEFAEAERRFPEIELHTRGIAAPLYNSVLNIALQAGRGPDIFLVRTNPMPALYARAGLVMPLDDRIPILAEYSQVSREAVSYRGQIYAIPTSIQTLQIFYNTEIFERFDLREPSTWDELLEIARTLQTNGVTPFFVAGREAWMWMLIHEVIGASFLRNEWTEQLVAGQVNFTDEKFVDSLRMLLELVPYFQPDFMATNDMDQATAFANGEVAMIFGGIERLTLHRLINPEIEGKIGMFLAPPRDRSQEPLAYTFIAAGIAVNARLPEEKREAVLRLANFLASREMGELLARKLNIISPVPGVVIDDDLPLSHQALGFLDRALEPIYANGSVFNLGRPSITQLMQRNLQEMVAGLIPPEEAARRIQVGISGWWHPGWSFDR
ncbi:MAG: ABC transporter substrate-binding protein [Candidatus Bipolaricaulia bacterium]